MRIVEGGVPKDILRSYSTDLGTGEFFTYVGNLVTIEQAISVIGVLSPDFVEIDDHVFWTANGEEFICGTSQFVGLKESGTGALVRSNERRDVERYQNNFSVSQFFTRWDGSSDTPIIKVGLNENDYRLCHLFAEQIAIHWKKALREAFPKRAFEFDVQDDLLDDFGVCVTFCQSSTQGK
ncbi:hypothetical protein [Thalassovita sp.]|uniref:hypothetical protein n=1 Tax=Thalassovita sp. TaxID=1979401 RepID=UPI0029DE543B|nr:hypothetical protein [Thalassovita sp.]